MKKTVGQADKIIRLVIAGIIAALYAAGAISGTLGIVLLIAAIVLVLTALTGFCGLYSLLGINTCKVK